MLDLEPWERRLQAMQWVLTADRRPLGKLGWLLCREPGEPGEPGERDQLQLKLRLVHWPQDTVHPGTQPSFLPLKILGILEREQLEPQDLAIRELLRSGIPGLPWNATGWIGGGLMLGLQQLVGHPRVFLARSGRWQPITLRSAEAVLALDQTTSGTLELEIRTPWDRWSWAMARAKLLPGLPRGRGGIVPIPRSRFCDLIVVHDLLAGLLREQGDGGFPEAAAAGLIKLLLNEAGRLPVRLGPGLPGAQPASQELIVQLEVLQTATGPALSCRFRVRPITNGYSHPPGQGPELLAVDDGPSTRFCQRDFDAEQRAAEMLARLLKLPSVPPTTGELLENPEEALALLATLERLERPFRTPGATTGGTSDANPLVPAFRVEWDGARRLRLARPATPQDLRVHARARQDWFSLDGRIEVDGGQASLAELLEAIRDGQRFLRVSEELWLEIDQSLRALLAPLDHAIEDCGGQPQITPQAVPVAQALEEVAAAGAQVQGVPDLLQLAARVREAGQLEPSLPETFQGTLRGYQLEGFRWILQRAAWCSGACLADDMGLGKTVQALAVLLARAEQGPALVVAPTSVGFNWVQEAQRFAPTLQVRHWTRGDQQAELLEGLRPGILLVTSYSLVRLHRETLTSIRFATLLLDEVQAVKNSQTHGARAVQGLHAEFRLALTGTPIENRTADLWSVFRAILPGLLGSADEFQSRFVRPIEERQDEQARERLRRLVAPFILRRVKAEVAPELPVKQEILQFVELSPPERAGYDRLRQAALEVIAETQGRRQRGGLILVTLTRLRQLACHPRLLEHGSAVPSAKLAALRELTARLVAEGHRLLIFSQFRRHLQLIREALLADGLEISYLDGQTPQARRRSEVEAFQQGRGQAFLLSLRAGNTGINLTGADRVILVDPWWNPAAENQAVDRAVRIGQGRAVTVIRLVTRDTIEEGILALQDRKRELIQALLRGAGASSSVSLEELLELIRDSRHVPESRAEPPRDFSESSSAHERLRPVHRGIPPNGGPRCTPQPSCTLLSPGPWRSRAGCGSWEGRTAGGGKSGL